MVKKSRGFRSGTRKKLEQKRRPLMTSFLREFSVDERVVILPEPSSSKGMPFPRFKGKVGKVVGKRGRSYVVEFYDGKKKKRVTARPEHLKLLNV
jgi:large subunit ribosomal protein L21e